MHGRLDGWMDGWSEVAAAMADVAATCFACIVLTSGEAQAERWSIFNGAATVL